VVFGLVLRRRWGWRGRWRFLVLGGSYGRILEEQNGKQEPYA